MSGAPAGALLSACENVRYGLNATARIDKGSRGVATFGHVLEAGDRPG